MTPRGDPAFEKDYQHWLETHQPFHWFAEFYDILAGRGGFDVIIGNPPYVEYSRVKKTYTIKNYDTERCGNLYALTLERLIWISRNKIGVIIPVASVCTSGYFPLQKILKKSGDLMISSYNDRPGKLFEGLEHIRLSIILINKSFNQNHLFFTTRYNKWNSGVRSTLFDKLEYNTTITESYFDGSIPKIGVYLENSILKKLMLQKRSIGYYSKSNGKYKIYYTRKLSYFVQISDFIPLIYDQNGNQIEPSELKEIAFDDSVIRDLFLALLNSNLFYWFLTVFSDCRNLNKREIYWIPFSLDNSDIVTTLPSLTRKLMEDLQNTSKMIEMHYRNLGTRRIQCIYPKYSKPIIDEIDAVLAEHYGFTEEELDFIINYDIKYRLGKELTEGEN